MALIDEIRTFLATNMTGKTIRAYQLDNEPDEQVMVLNAPAPDDVSLRAGVSDTKIIAFSRGARGGMTAARTNIITVYGLLHGKMTDFGATPIQIVKATCNPYFVGPDENGRPMFSCDFTIRAKGVV